MSDCSPLAVSFGGGTNSTAMLCGFKERGIRPDVILFADTGGEQPHTYAHLAEMDAQCQVWWGIGIQTVYPVRAGKRYTLEEHSLNTRMLPSLAYGLRSCSQRFKHEPLEAELVRWCRKHGNKTVRKAIGYGADEPGRGSKTDPTKKLTYGVVETYWYPLREWGWGRNECKDAIARHGLTQPGKSSCFFCPAMTIGEIYRLRDEQPELLQRALAIEDKAQERHRKVIGLGGDNSFWRTWLEADAKQLKLLLDVEPNHRPCNCTD